MITIKRVAEENFDECVDLAVHDSQRGFVASNMYSLAQAWLYHEVARPFAIYNDDVMVGFVMLHYDASAAECGIWRFMIDKRYQHMGYGKEAMRVVLDYIKDNASFKKVKLSFEPENTVAEKLYGSFGFQPTGEMDEGEIVMALNIAG